MTSQDAVREAALQATRVTGRALAGAGRWLGRKAADGWQAITCGIFRSDRRMRFRHGEQLHGVRVASGPRTGRADLPLDVVGPAGEVLEGRKHIFS